MKFSIQNIFKEHQSIINLLADDETILEKIEQICIAVTNCFKSNGKVLLCGNGGSAADAQHIAAELSGKFYLDRAPLYAEALHVNSSSLTATANDYGFAAIFARQIMAKASSGDILIAISTSGTSENILNALSTARGKKVMCIGFNGRHQNMMNDLCDICINIPSAQTPRIQEAHILIGHIICEFVESNIFADQ